MPDGGAGGPVAGARIGPNAVLQLVPVLQDACGPAETAALLAAAGLAGPPATTGLMDEAPAIALHRAVRAAFAGRSEAMLSDAGRRTAAYILAHRIPPAARALLRALPPRLAGPLLARAIARHAWTFAGSGQFVLESTRPATFAIHANPLVRGEAAPRPLCHWHRAVFATLFRRLVDPASDCRETACCAAGSISCRFQIVSAD